MIHYSVGYNEGSCWSKRMLKADVSQRVYRLTKPIDGRQQRTAMAW